jgi:hypothetical protein
VGESDGSGGVGAIGRLTERTIMGKTKRVGIYLGVSTTGQTVENQRQELLRVAEQQAL